MLCLWLDLLICLCLLVVNSVVVVCCAFMCFNDLWLFWLMWFVWVVIGYVWLVCYCSLGLLVLFVIVMVFAIGLQFAGFCGLYIV